MSIITYFTKKTSSPKAVPLLNYLPSSLAFSLLGGDIHSI